MTRMRIASAASVAVLCIVAGPWACLSPAGAECAGERCPRALELDLESGAVWSGYNDVRIPREGGTDVSLSEDLSIDPEIFWRARLSWRIGERHLLSALVAPLRLEAAGAVPTAVVFEGVEFPASTPLEGRYRFDSYRLTYRYDFRRGEKLDAGIGFTAKIRDAAIRLAGGGLVSEKTNTGFVPLLNLNLEWRFAGDFSLLVNADALAAPQGRAEDVLAALCWRASDRVAVRAGYRFVEGGADVAEVYNFALIHYASLGITVKL